MFKKSLLFVLFILSFTITGCSFSNKLNQNDNIKRFYLEDKYYHKGDFIKIDSRSFENIKNESFVLFTYNNYCSMAKPCEEIFKEFMKKYKIDFLSMSFEEFKNTDIYKSVKYAPSIIIIEKGKIISYLDAESDEDLNKYQDINEFEKWINNYVYFSNKNK